MTCVVLLTTDEDDESRFVTEFPPKARSTRSRRRAQTRLRDARDITVTFIHHVGVDVENDDGARDASDGCVVFFFSPCSIDVVHVVVHVVDAFGDGMDEEPRTSRRGSPREDSGNGALTTDATRAIGRVRAMGEDTFFFHTSPVDW